MTDELSEWVGLRHLPDGNLVLFHVFDSQVNCLGPAIFLAYLFAAIPQ